MASASHGSQMGKRDLLNLLLLKAQPGNSTSTSAVCALGGSVATPNRGIRAEVLEVKSFVELKKLVTNIDGKIVFFNRPMDPTKINTFSSYSGAVNQRTEGAEEAIKLGIPKKDILLTENVENTDYPHTGVMSYGQLPPSKRIPAAAISTNASEKLSNLLLINPNLKFLLRQQCKQYADVKSYNVIGEIKGSEFPNKIILVGGHLDSWDLGDGAHDDGAGIVQSMEVLRLLKKMNYNQKEQLELFFL